MIGRGTRLCKNLFGPGEDKKFFWIFDYCQNLEYFSIDNGNENTPIQETISSKLFKTEVEILQALDKELYKEKQQNILRTNQLKCLKIIMNYVLK